MHARILEDTIATLVVQKSVEMSQDPSGNFLLMEGMVEHLELQRNASAPAWVAFACLEFPLALHLA